MILSVGTRVVTKVDTAPIGGGQICPAGIVGVVVAAPADHEHAYRVRCANGLEISVLRREIEMLARYQSEGLSPQNLSSLALSPHSQAPHGLGPHGLGPLGPLGPVPDAPGSHAAPLRGALDEYGLRDRVIYKCVIGSRAYGLDTDASDTDYRGIYLPPADLHWSLYGAPEQLENEAAQECYWELQKFIVLALKANPNVLECLYTPLVEHVAPPADELLSQRDMFLSKLVYQTYNGYVLSQFQKIERDLRNKGAVKSKHAMHLIRLLLSGIQVLKEGFVPVRVDAHRDGLLAIRDGQMSWEKIEAWRLTLHAEFDEAFAKTRLPDRPDYERASALLIKARRNAV
jgi:hypothetical protein